jgi:hypothetical protein
MPVIEKELTLPTKSRSMDRVSDDRALPTLQNDAFVRLSSLKVPEVIQKMVETYNDPDAADDDPSYQEELMLSFYFGGQYAMYTRDQGELVVCYLANSLLDFTEEAVEAEELQGRLKSFDFLTEFKHYFASWYQSHHASLAFSHSSPATK